MCPTTGLWRKEKPVNFGRMNLRDLNTRKTPVVTVDESLARFKGKVISPRKLAKANDAVRKFGLPESGVLPSG
jgi:hypothetical protein